MSLLKKETKLPELLLELGCEEIPAEDLFVLQEEIRIKAMEAFELNRLTPSNVETQVTPRRLMLKAEMVSTQADLKEVRMGPPRKIDPTYKAYTYQSTGTGVGLYYGRKKRCLVFY